MDQQQLIIIGGGIGFLVFIVIIYYIFFSSNDLVVNGNIIMRHPNGQEWVIGMRDPNHFAINKLDKSGKNRTDGSGILIRSDGHMWTGGGEFNKGNYDPEWHNLWFHNIFKARR
jgi:hypothetical protein